MAEEYSPAGRTVRTGSRVAGEYSPARCTRDKPEAEEFFSASYLHPTAKVLLLLTQPAWEDYPAGHTNHYLL